MRRAVSVTVIAALAWSWACSKDDNDTDSDGVTADEGSTQDDSSASDDDGSSDGAGGNPNDSQADDMSPADATDEPSADDSSADDPPADDPSADDPSAGDDAANPADDGAPADDDSDPGSADDMSEPDDSAADDVTVDDADPGDDPAVDDDAMSGAGGTSGAGGEPGMDMEGAGGSEAGDDDSGGEVTPGSDSASDDGSMSFFVTSVGGPDGGNFGGVEGADAFCAELAAAVSSDLGAKPWRAYLSVADEDARDRIGTGPWRNADGDIIANDIDELHDQDMGALDATWPPADLGIALTETGEEVTNSEHDILTGTQMDGTWDEDLDCDGWTSNSSDLQATVGHSNRDGGGRPPYFNATHQVGCAPTTGNYEDGTISQGGGRGSIYCFVRIVE